MTYDYNTTGNSAVKRVDCPGCGVTIDDKDPPGCPDCMKKYGVGVMVACAKEGDYLLMTNNGSSVSFSQCWVLGDWLYLYDVEVSGTIELEQMQINLSEVVFLGTLVDTDDEDDPETEPEPDPEESKKEDQPWQAWMGRATGLPQPPDLVAPIRERSA